MWDSSLFFPPEKTLTAGVHIVLFFLSAGFDAIIYISHGGPIQYRC